MAAEVPHRWGGPNMGPELRVALAMERDLRVLRPAAPRADRRIGIFLVALAALGAGSAAYVGTSLLHPARDRDAVPFAFVPADEAEPEAPVIAPEVLADLAPALVPEPEAVPGAAAPETHAALIPQPAGDPVPPQAFAPAPRLVPLPVARPPEFRIPRSAAVEPRVRTRRAPRVAAAPSAPPADDRNFIEKMFGIERTETPRLAYAALETKPVDNVFRRALSAVPAAGGVAVYDIRAKQVTLPSGERLEAHSGLGERMDDPSHTHVRMAGPTPVGTYDLTEREQAFHGVRAIRLNPVGGAGAIHGRTGLLAHTYMLGASGASNGCVAFKDYDRFLQAYLRGDVQRLVVVAGG
jgi:hypothetical protein